MSNENDYAIVTEDLDLWYGDFQALEKVSLNLRSGIITGLIGPSGCGKTTFLRCLNRVNERYGNVRTEGTINLLGKNIYDPDVSLIELRKSVGMVFQRPNPLPISVYENIVFGLRVPYSGLCTCSLMPALPPRVPHAPVWHARPSPLGPGYKAKTHTA